MLVVTEEAPSQSYRTINYTVDNGLPSSEVYQVIQDRQGYIWFATNQGVSRFNGYEFQNFSIADGLLDNSVLEIYEDHKGRIWFIPLSCKLCYFYHDSIHSYKYNDAIQKEKKLMAPPIKSGFFVDREENIYLSLAYAGLIRVSATGATTIMEAKSDYYKKYTMIFLPNQEKTLCSITQAAGAKGISVLKNDLFFHIPYPLYKNGTNRIGAISYRNKILFFYFDKLMVIENEKVTKEYRFDSSILWMSKEDNGNIWISVYRKGMYLFQNTDYFTSPEAYFFKGLTVSSVVKDAEDAYWFTTLEKGVFYISSKEIKAFTSREGLNATKINTIDAYKNNIWFAGNHSELYNLNSGKLTILDYFKKPDCYYEFVKYDHDKLYLGGAIPGEFNVLDHGQVKNLYFNYFKNIYFINENEYFLFYHGVSKFQNGQIIQSPVLNGLQSRTYCICGDNDGNHWIGTEHGLFMYKKNGRLEHLAQKNKLLGFRIQDLLFDGASGNLWMATKGGGLVLKTQNSVIQFTTKNGLPDNSLSSLFLDGKDLWIATCQGLAKLEIDHAGLPYKFSSIKASDGLISNEINKVLVKDSIVYLATNDGLCFFDKKKVKPNNVPPPIYIKGIKINDLDAPIVNEYQLPYYRNNVTIEYVGLSYKNAGKIDYMYKMDGIDSTWRKTKNRAIRFPLLQPGKYTFMVKAVNEAGVMSTQTAKSIFMISKPYWQTLWFRAAITLLLIAISLVIFYLVIKELKKRMILEKDMNIYRQQALSSQMNPHFIFNSLNSVQKYILENNKDSSQIYLSKIAILMREILENSQHQEITLYAEIKALKTYVELEQVRFSHNFQFELTICDHIDLHNIKIPPLILQPYVENAIHHGLRNKKGDKKLLITIRKDVEFNHIIIEDNGVGRKKADEIKNRKGNTYKSLGTQITNNRLEVYKKLYKNNISISYIDLTDDTGQASGTKVTITLKEN